MMKQDGFQTPANTALRAAGSPVLAEHCPRLLCDARWHPQREPGKSENPKSGDPERVSPRKLAIRSMGRGIRVTRETP